MTNSIANLVRGKKMGVTHEKMAIWPHKWGFVGRMLIFQPKILSHFPGEMINSLISLIREKKVGVTHEKMSIWPQKPYHNEV